MTGVCNFVFFQFNAKEQNEVLVHNKESTVTVYSFALKSIKLPPNILFAAIIVHDIHICFTYVILKAYTSNQL